MQYKILQYGDSQYDLVAIRGLAIRSCCNTGVCNTDILQYDILFQTWIFFVYIQIYLDRKYRIQNKSLVLDFFSTVSDVQDTFTTLHVPPSTKQVHTCICSVGIQRKSPVARASAPSLARAIKSIIAIVEAHLTAPTSATRLLCAIGSNRPQALLILQKYYHEVRSKCTHFLLHETCYAFHVFCHMQR